MDRIAVCTSMTYGVLSILIGVITLTVKGDLMSFIAGTVTGLLVLVSLMVGNKVNHSVGYGFIVAISLVFGAYSGINFANDNSFVPSGIMAILSATTLVVVGLNWLSSNKKVQAKAKN